MSESAYKAFEIHDGIFVRICGKGTDIDASNFGRQTYPVTYDANGYVDVVRTILITNANRLHGDIVYAYITDIAYEIDEIEDIAFVDYVLQRNDFDVENLFIND
mgnify:CR=1 FL=1